MDAIKKKMQAMKVEKDNAMDRADACEESSKAAKLRAEKAQEEVADLMNKTRYRTVGWDWELFFILLYTGSQTKCM